MNRTEVSFTDWLELLVGLSFNFSKILFVISFSNSSNMPGMNSKCFVPGYRSGYKTCSDKVSLFQPPSDPLLLNQWQRIIPRADLVLTRKHKVCEKHFAPELIERKYVINIGGQRVEIDRERPRLWYENDMSMRNTVKWRSILSACKS